MRVIALPRCQAVDQGTGSEIDSTLPRSAELSTSVPTLPGRPSPLPDSARCVQPSHGLLPVMDAVTILTTNGDPPAPLVGFFMPILHTENSSQANRGGSCPELVRFLKCVLRSREVASIEFNHGEDQCRIVPLACILGGQGEPLGSVELALLSAEVRVIEQDFDTRPRHRSSLPLGMPTGAPRAEVLAMICWTGGEVLRDPIGISEQGGRFNPRIVDLEGLLDLFVAPQPVPVDGCGSLQNPCRQVVDAGAASGMAGDLWHVRHHRPTACAHRGDDHRAVRHHRVQDTGRQAA